ncbi:hypothetical protein BpHYR1_014316 [Brachionus plicatilis]|uniref:Uncharacterized protein n=1 Tax=Brachionus plicatilis TaxID=10195 RepID=A0A3M7R5T3_BRAPC|nr:hypothetical protein BpHYR1_014316 [Brachionus plicatilis]
MTRVVTKSVPTNLVTNFMTNWSNYFEKNSAENKYKTIYVVLHEKRSLYAKEKFKLQKKLSEYQGLQFKEH